MVIPTRTARAATLRHPELVSSIVLQPIIDVSTGAVIAAEALARFADSPGRVEETFASAHAAGRGKDLEAACLRAALARRADLPPGVALTVNVSPDALGHPAVRHALAGSLKGVIVEITELAATDGDALMREIAGLRRRDARIAVDDATTGYAGLSRLAAIRPDIVKLDRAVVSGSRDSIERTAIIDAIVSLCRRLGAQVLGEGVETMQDLTALAALDVDFAQGYAIAPPATALAAPSPLAIATCRSARRELMRVKSGANRPLLDDDLHAVTAALAGCADRADLQAALEQAALRLNIDVIGLSVLGPGELLREICSAGGTLDPTSYRLSTVPATQAALASGMITEAHVDDEQTDHAEREILVRNGLASLLMAPLIADGVPLGILEFSQRTRGRWRAHELAQARLLADHVAQVLSRLPVGDRS